jgi:hypothetical protein
MSYEDGDTLGCPRDQGLTVMCALGGTDEGAEVLHQCQKRPKYR